MMKFRIVESGGYKIQEVDRFTRKFNKTETSNLKQRSISKLQRVKFSLTRNQGYDPQEVDDYLDSILNQNMMDLETRPENSALSSIGLHLNSIPVPTMTSTRLREVSPPVVEEVGYSTEEVDKFLNLVADTLQFFEDSPIEEIQRIKADQYNPQGKSPKLLTGDQVRWALFTVSETGGYDILAVDAAAERLSDALDFHWRKSE